MDHYFTISKIAVAEFKERGSRFIAYAYPVTTIIQCKEQLKALKKEHPKAVHHCFAYRLGTDKNNFRVSDDGEPGGTAGKQILGQIDNKNLTDIIVIVVRYFGGTLLGIPGLIQAYKTTTSLALQLTPVIQRPIECTYIIQFSHTYINDVITVIKKYECTIHRQQLELFCRIKVGIPKKYLAETLNSLREIHTVELSVPAQE